jgi:hypothetical protein
MFTFLLCFVLIAQNDSYIQESDTDFLEKAPIQKQYKWYKIFISLISVTYEKMVL